MSTGTEDRREAATIYTSISTYVATATLALVAGAVVLLTYFAGQYHRLFFFFVGVGLAVGTLGASLFFGGRGLNEVAKKGATGDWSIEGRSEHFNLQALLALVGAALPVVSVVVALAAGISNSNLAANATQRAGDSVAAAIRRERVVLSAIRQGIRTEGQELLRLAGTLARQRPNSLK